MKQRVSRRNRRTASTQARSTRDLTILAISLVIFIGGSTSLAWALHSQPKVSDESARSSSRQSIEQSDPYIGAIMPGIAPDDARGLDTAQQTQQSAQADDARSEVPDASEGTTSADTVQDALPTPDTATATVEQAPETDMRQGYIVHHTAYREQPVYRTVHHQASTAREVTVAGKTHIEWTRCPVCDQRHSSPYNERVLDHVTPVPCIACGCRHETDYDETVYK